MHLEVLALRGSNGVPCVTGELSKRNEIFFLPKSSPSFAFCCSPSFPKFSLDSIACYHVAPQNRSN
uniref:Uncharacterized protein n=1 Tax=Arundo donax TaxID=35708 RepID=A0A0A8ZBY3_ARUDO